MRAGVVVVARALRKNARADRRDRQVPISQRRSETMRQLAMVLVTAVLVVGCAGGPAAIQMAPNKKTVVVNGMSVDVAESDGLWGATASRMLSGLGFLSSADIARRNANYRQAIELVSGCRVIDATSDQASGSMNASVRCDAPTLVPRAIEASSSVPKNTAGGEQSSAAPSGGRDLYNAEQVAHQAACHQRPRAVLTGRGPGFETYAVGCSNGDQIVIRCEFGNCRVLR